ncbi:MAG: RHS repeat-associated core domain-containing protein, partial [Verrucomicrobiota bacterium]
RNSNPAADKNVGAPETTSLSYDARGFLTGVAYPDGKGFTFEYNAAGRRIRRVGHDGYALNYGYDSAGRLETLTDGAGHELVRYAYDSAGRLVRETKGNGTFTTYSHDLAGQIVALTNYGPASVSAGNPQADKNVGAPGAQGAPTFLSAPVQSFFNYTYDAKGNRRSMTTATGVTSYEYDALNQLTGVTYPGGRHVTYAYDAAGNRTVVNDTGANTIYTANNLNQYTQVGATTFGYDADGNLVHRTDATGITTYEYDAENRLVRVVTPTNGVWQYTYDALGNRTAVAHDGVTSRYLHDPIGLVDVAAEYDAAGSLVARYDHALGLVARSDAAGNAAFYSFDALGNTRELIGDAGSLLNSYDYDAFGAATLVNETVANGFQFVGRFGVDHDQTGMHFMRARYYHPNVGRFGNIDPIRFLGGFNVYQYAKNNPLLLIDPLGLDDFSDMFPTFGSPAADEYFQRELRAYEQGFQATLTSVGDFFGNIELFTPKSFGEGPGFGGGLTLGVSYGVGYGVGIGAGVVNGIPTPIKPGFGAEVFAGLELGGGYGGFQGVCIVCWSPPTPPTDPAGGDVDVPVVRPIDPNDKVAPAGVGPNRVIPSTEAIEYMIRFENRTNASAPVQELVVVDYLDANLDWTTLQFGDIAYGDRLMNVPADALQYSIRDLPPTNSPAVIGVTEGPMAVDMSVMFNPQTGRVEWRLKAIDSKTGLPPADALAGLLPPHADALYRNGHVSFSVKPRTDAPLGTVITNRATIVFDTEDPIDTPPVWNTLGDTGGGRVTAMSYLPAAALASPQTVASAQRVTAAFSPVIFTATGDQMPRLTIKQLGNAVELSWPASAADFTIETTDSQASQIQWVELTNSAVVVGGQNTITVSPSDSTRFYRLRKK